MSFFASQTQSDPIPIPFDLPHTIVVRQLTGEEYRASINESEGRITALFRRALAAGGVKDPAVFAGAKLVLGSQALGLEKHSLGQLCQHIGMPQRFATDLISAEVDKKGNAIERPWAKQLFVHNVRELLKHDGGKYLVRAIGGNARGIMSNAYRRLDSAKLVEAFGKAVHGIGAMVVGGTASLTRVELKVALPYIFEPVPNEVMTFGLSWSNSDYGNGSHSLRLMCNRLWCTNKAITSECLREIHLGKRLEEDVAFSEKTYRLDSEASASALGDIVRHALSPESLGKFQEVVVKATEEKVERTRVPNILGKLDLQKDEIIEITKAFESSDNVMMPEGETMWRLSNAISYFAGHRCEDADRRLELERAAGKVLPEMAKAA